MASANKEVALARMIPSFSPHPSVHLSTPPPATYQTWPSEPQVLLPPASDHFSLSHPFNIDPTIYNNALHVSVPITIAIAYATTVYFINRYNASRNHEPWAISKTISFFTFVVVHNVVLAMYSAWTFMGMLNAIRQTWPGYESREDLPKVVDSLCKMHGPRGYGSAATWNSSNSTWSVSDNVTKLLGGQPDSSDVGRMWNAGLAYYGWIFYISKFYEVVDSLIVLAKGKRTGFLQTYHHAGAMMAMWAGIRYMSPPIWMFTFINSGLHTLMYTYYTAAALNIRVPRILKRTLTTLQIIQIVFGSSYAFAHFWISYDMPTQVPYLFTHNLLKAVSSVSSALPSATSSLVSAASTATASAGIGSLLKKVALRAGGHEGLAENVRNEQGEAFGVDAIHSSQVEKAQEETRYKLEYQRVSCLDSSGEVTAILLNLAYLLPLAWLFVRFFVDSYTGRRKSPPPPPSRYENIKASSKDAAQSVEEKIKEAMDDENSGKQVDRPEDLSAQLDDIKAKTEDAAGKAQEGIKDFVQNTKVKAKEAAQKAKQMEESIVQNVMSASRESTGGFEKVEHEDAEPEEGGAKIEPKEESENAKEELSPEDERSKPSNGGSTSTAPKAEPSEPQSNDDKENAKPSETPQSRQDKDAEDMPPPSANGAPKKSSSRPPPASRSSSIPAPTPKKGKKNKSRSTSRQPASKPDTPAPTGGKDGVNGDVPPKENEGEGEGEDAGNQKPSPEDNADGDNPQDPPEEKKQQDEDQEAQGMEVNPDTVLDEQEKEAQKVMQP